MKLKEILAESTEEQLKEGPILNKIGTAVGKGVGTLAKGVGAVAGGVAGLGKAVKKGYQAGKATVGGAGDTEPAAGGAAAPATQGGAAPAASGGGTAQPAATNAPAAPAAQGGAAPAKQKPQSKFDKLATAAGLPSGDTEPADQSAAAPAQQPDAQPPAAKGAPAQTAQPPATKGAEPAPAADAANDSAYAKAQKSIQSLPPEQQKEILSMLQTDPKVKAALAAPAAKKPAAKAPANTMANAPVSKVNKAKPGNPNVAPAAKKPAPTATTGTVQQKQLTPAGFGQMVQGLTKKAG